MWEKVPRKGVIWERTEELSREAFTYHSGLRREVLGKVMGSMKIRGL